MSAFLYYVPNVDTIASLDNTGLDAESLFGSIGFSTVVVEKNGPDKGSGIILAANNADFSIGYYPDSQKWSEADRFWLGVSNDSIPTPRTLERDELVGGHKVKLDDGNEWLVPVARAFPMGTRLPRRLNVGPEGQIVTTILPKYIELSNRAECIWQELHGGAFTTPFEEAFSIAVDALAVNYRVSRFEVSLLNLLTTQNLEDLLAALVDFPTFRRWLTENTNEKKKRTAISS